MTAATVTRCSWAACPELATTSTPEGWDFCAKHAAADTKMKDDGDLAVRRPAGAPTKSLPVPLQTSSPIALLLEDASAHGSAKVRSLGTRIETQLDQLRALIAEHAETERKRRADEEAKRQARAEVARLEEQLRQAKARLRGTPPPPLPKRLPRHPRSRQALVRSHCRAARAAGR